MQSATQIPPETKERDFFIITPIKNNFTLPPLLPAIRDQLQTTQLGSQFIKTIIKTTGITITNPTFQCYYIKLTFQRVQQDKCYYIYIYKTTFLCSYLDAVWT